MSTTGSPPAHKWYQLRDIFNIFRVKPQSKITAPTTPSPVLQKNNRQRTPPSIIISPPSPRRLHFPSPAPPPPPATSSSRAYNKTKIIDNDLPSRPPSPPTTPPERISPSSSHGSLPSLINDGRSSIDSDTLRPPTPPPRFGFDIFEPRGGAVIIGGAGWPYLLRLGAIPVPTDTNVGNEVQQQRQRQQQPLQQRQNQPRGGRGESQNRDTGNGAHH